MSDKNRKGKSKDDKNSHLNRESSKLQLCSLYAEWFLIEAGFTPLKCMVNELLLK